METNAFLQTFSKNMKMFVALQLPSTCLKILEGNNVKTKTVTIKIFTTQKAKTKKYPYIEVCVVDEDPRSSLYR